MIAPPLLRTELEGIVVILHVPRGEGAAAACALGGRCEGDFTRGLHLDRGQLARLFELAAPSGVGVCAEMGEANKLASAKAMIQTGFMRSSEDQG
jgi:hypothetical protein